jgi:hypothetical protein
MKKYLKTVAGIMLFSAGTISAEAADYAGFSNEELVQQRSQVRQLAPEDRESYRTEMQSRMQSMSSDERALFRETNNMGGQGDGSGKMNRYGRGDSQGYGSGYGSRQGGGNGRGRHSR